MGAASKALVGRYGPCRLSAIPCLLAGLLWLVAPGELSASLFDDARLSGRIEAQLADVGPEAARIFREAGRAAENGELTRASALYAEFSSMEPKFDHAYRRRGWVEWRLGNKDLALTLFHRAVGLERSFQNLKAAAMALDELAVEGTDSFRLLLTESLVLAKEAGVREPTDIGMQRLLCRIGAELSDHEVLAGCSAILKVLEPSEPWGYYYEARYETLFGRTDLAREALELAREKGLPAMERDLAADLIRRSTPLYRSVERPLKVMLALWASVALGLILAGLYLSGRTMEAVRGIGARSRGLGTSVPGVPRRAYGAVLWLCCIFYFVSLPLVVVVTALGGVWVASYLTWRGRFAGLEALCAGYFTLTSIRATWMALTWRPDPWSDPSRLDVERHPRFQAVLEEVASKLGTEPVTDVRLDPYMTFSVYEEGGLIQRLRGRGRRVLRLGVGALESNSVLTLKSTLAHEYGHLANRDTAGGDLVMKVTGSLGAFWGSLAGGWSWTWLNPAVWFGWAFWRIFHRITQGESRLREIMADRWAVAAYGARSFELGFRRDFEREVLLQARLDWIYDELIAKGKPPSNIYTCRVENSVSQADLERHVEERINARATPYDSHPPVAERIELAWNLAAPEHTPAPEDLEPAWSLFSDRAAIEERMTRVFLEWYPPPESPPEGSAEGAQLTGPSTK